MTTESQKWFAEAVALHQAGRFSEAEGLYRRVVEIDPHVAVVWHYFGLAKFQLGEYEAAVELMRRSLAVDPNVADVYCNLGVAVQKLGRWEESIVAMKRALELHPNLAVAHYNVGVALAKLDRGEAAVAAYEKAIACRPDFPAAYHNAGSLILATGNLNKAADYLEKAVHLQPDFIEALVDLGNAYFRLGRKTDAYQTFQIVLRLKPDHPVGLYNLGAALLEEGRISEARQWLLQADAREPGCADVELMRLAQQDCRWDEFPQRMAKIESLVKLPRESGENTLNPFAFITMPIASTSEQQLAVAKRWAARYRKALRPMRRPEPSMPAGRSTQVDEVADDKPTVGRRWKIGYLSADFHEHATAWLIAELFERHARDRFEVLGYSIGHDDGGPTRRRLVQAFDGFRDLTTLSDHEAAQAIADDELDILVDLKGYTQHARPEILAFRPAPIQISYLGFPGTMGADFIDYLLVDEYVVPPNRQPYYHEKLIYLPGCYQVNDSKVAIVETKPTRRECGLPDEAVVCCSFNHLYKLTPHMFGIWMRLLTENPKAVLWLAADRLEVMQRIWSYAVEQRVEPERIVFADKQSHARHLARLPLADLFLDSYPVNAHTTAGDALRMGVPLLTLSGESFISRVAGSLLSYLGLPELIALSYEEYQAKGLKLVGNADELLSVRMKLKDRLRASDLFTGAAFAHKLELVFERLIADHTRVGRPTDSARS